MTATKTHGAGTGGARLSLSALLTTAAVLAGAGPAAADEAAGAEIARRWCAACHLVADDQQTGVEGVPAFRAIAATGDRDTIRSVLFEPHPPMPQFSLSRREVESVVDYIVSLGDPNPSPGD